MSAPILRQTRPAPSTSTNLIQLAREATPSVVKLTRLFLLHKTTIIGLALLGAVAAGALAFVVTPIYRANTTVLVDTNKNKVVSIDEVYGANSNNREYFQTQIDFLRSREVGLRVVRDLKLIDNPMFDGRQSSLLGSAIKLISGDGAEPSVEQLENIALQRLQAALTIAQVRTGQLINVAFESPDPHLAAQVANTVADQYIRADLDARFEITQKANVWLNERLTTLRDKLTASENALQKYRDEQGIVEGRNTVQGSAGKQLDEISQKLVQARVVRAQAEQVYQLVRSNATQRYQVPQVFNNPAVARAREQESAAEAKLNDAAQKVGTAHPSYRAAQSELTQARQNTARQVDAVVGSIAKDYEVAVATERALEDALNRARSSLQQFNRKELQLDALDREAASNRQIYQTFLSRTKETGATADFLTPVARVIDPANPPLSALRPQKVQWTLAGLVLGLLLGGFVVWLRERMSQAIRSIEEVDNLLDAPLIAALPLVPRAQIERSNLVQVEHPNSQFAESIRTILTGVQLATVDARPPIIGFTSSVPGEGKSTIAANFALEQSRSKTVLLIDLDLRRPTLGSRLGIPGDSKGASDLLAGSAEIGQCLFTFDSRKLTVMPAGRVRANAHELLVGNRLAEILAQLKGRFDMIVIDTPPAHVVSDVLLVAGQCTGLVFVVRSGQTPVPIIRRNLSRLEQADIKVFGIALNGHDFHQAERYYGEYSGFAKYGYESTYGKPST